MWQDDLRSTELLAEIYRDKAERLAAGERPSAANRFSADDILDAHARGDYAWLTSAIESHLSRETVHWWNCSQCIPGPADRGVWFKADREGRCREGQALHDEWLELRRSLISMDPGEPFTLQLRWPDGSAHEVDLLRGLNRTEEERDQAGPKGN